MFSSVLTLKISDVVPAPVRDRQVSILSCSECDLWWGQQSGGRSDLVPAQLGRPTRQLGVRGGAGARSSAVACATVLRERTRAAAASRPPPPPCPSLPRPHCPSNCSVSVESQVVQLPTSSANLSALVSPPPGPDSQYNVTVLLVPRVNCLLVVTILPAV